MIVPVWELATPPVCMAVIIYVRMFVILDAPMIASKAVMKLASEDVKVPPKVIAMPVKENAKGIVEEVAPVLVLENAQEAAAIVVVLDALGVAKDLATVDVLAVLAHALALVQALVQDALALARGLVQARVVGDVVVAMGRVYNLAQAPV